MVRKMLGGIENEPKTDGTLMIFNTMLNHHTADRDSTVLRLAQF